MIISGAGLSPDIESSICFTGLAALSIELAGSSITKEEVVVVVSLGPMSVKTFDDVDLASVPSDLSLTLFDADLDLDCFKTSSTLSDRSEVFDSLVRALVLTGCSVSSVSNLLAFALVLGLIAFPPTAATSSVASASSTTFFGRPRFFTVITADMIAYPDLKEDFIY